MATYREVDWQDLPDISTPITADRLNYMDRQIGINTTDIGNRVEKSGDTMTGMLMIDNVNSFDGVKKNRTVDGNAYSIVVGIGADKAGKVQYQKNGTTVNGLKLNEDGTIYNEKTNKQLVEKSNTTGSGTINNTYVSSVENNHWEQNGNVVSYSFTIVAKGTWDYTTTFISGLPKPVANTRFNALLPSRQIPIRLEIRTNGTLRNAYSQTTPADGNSMEGQITYITSDN